MPKRWKHYDTMPMKDLQPGDKVFGRGTVESVHTTFVRGSVFEQTVAVIAFEGDDTPYLYEAEDLFFNVDREVPVDAYAVAYDKLEKGLIAAGMGFSERVVLIHEFYVAARER